eukprot:TRINITY_DN5874_c0_g1_i1.p1 TRINITY_DN5874_c0_g1~~TRINITY_DN5874_c0_g1_i1.p1  ORF type:complete len:393 (+),score=60.28 TRINITY_DN5874_c0_g1_i1:88-1266(+)
MDSVHPEIRLRFRFKRIVRRILVDVKFELDKRKRSNTNEDLGDADPNAARKRRMVALTFDVNAFSPQVRSCGDIAGNAKIILRKPAHLRTPEELRTLIFLVHRLKCFDKYAHIDRKDLARILHYECFPAGRTLLEQGHPGMAFYFIVSGALSVVLSDGDDERLVNEMGPGDSFGELALLDPSNTRTATIRVTKAAELLRVDRSEFDTVLKKSLDYEWQVKFNGLKRHQLFQDWNDAEIRSALNNTRKNNFKPGEVIFDGKEEHDVEYAVLQIEGLTRLVRRLPVQVKKSGLCAFRKGLLHQGKEVLATMAVCQPNMLVPQWSKSTCMVAETACTVLTIAKIVFLKHDSARSLKRWFLESAFLSNSDKDIFDRYAKSQSWCRYKYELTKSLRS